MPTRVDGGVVPDVIDDNVGSMKVCEDLVLELSQRDEAWPFLKPVTKKEVCRDFI